MNSINKNQPQDNFKDLNGHDAIVKLKELAVSAATCFFISNIKTGLPVSARPMTVLDVDNEGNLWFLLADDNVTYQELKEEPLAQLFFQGAKYSDYLNVYGQIKLSRDKTKIKELWSPELKNWFTEGEEDPRIAVVELEPTEAYYWDNEHSNTVAFIKHLAGAVMGKAVREKMAV